MKTHGFHPKTSLRYILHHVLLLLSMVSLLTSCQSSKVIVNGLDEKDANEILVFLSSKGIVANKTQAATEGAAGGKAVLWNISVESSRANEAMALLNQVGLPRRPSRSLLNIFSNVGLVPSGMQEKIRYQSGLGEQIASTIRKIDGVLDAEVLISFPEEDPLNPGATKEKITASVYVKHSGILDDPNAHLISRIKRLVAGSVPGLEFDYVTVIPDRARFSETPLGGFPLTLGEERPYVNVWSIVLAQDSLARFRLIFFSFIIALLILLLGVIWLFWKLFPILKQSGGLGQLFSFHPISRENLTPTPPPTEGKAEEKESKTGESDQGSDLK